MGRTLYYMAHDPVGNSEAVLTEYDAELIARAAESGIVFVAVDENGGRAIVPPDSVKEPELEDRPITLVQPSYVDDRITAVVDVFDALASELFEPALSTMSLDSGDDDGILGGFLSALARLKGIANGGL